MKLIIFDCDGTLIDSQAGIVLSMKHAFESLGMTPSLREATLSEAFAKLAPEAEYVTRFELAERYKRAFIALDHNPDETDVLFPECHDLIADLAERDDVMLGIATGKSRRGVDRLLAREGWQDLFATIQTADDHPSKPHPSMIFTALQETDSKPDKTVMIGDTSYDVEMARTAQVGAIGVTWGYHTPQELELAGAHAIINNCENLPHVIDDVLQQVLKTSSG